MNALWTLIAKDLALYFGNRRALLITLVAPIAMAGFFGFLFNPQNAKPTKVDVVLTDLDQSPLSRQVVQALAADESLQLREAPREEAAEAVRRAKARVAIVLPAGLGATAPAAMFGGTAKPEVTLLHDPSQPMALAVVRGLLSQALSQAVGGQLFSAEGTASLRQRASAAGLPPARQHDLQQLSDAIERVQRHDNAASAPGAAASAPALSLPVTLRAQEAVAQGAQRYDGYAHAFAGMGVQFILFAGIDFGVGLLMMRRQGLWRRLRAAPISRSQLLGSRIASGAIIALLLVLAIFGAGMVLFGVRIQGSVTGFAAISLAFALMTASFGMLVAAFGRTPEATRSLAIFATLVMVMLGGAWVPSFLFPEWVQTLGLVVPARWAVDGFDAMTWRGLGLEAAIGPTLALLGFAALFGLLAVWRFDWDE